MELKLYNAATQGDVQALKEVIDSEPKLINSVTPQQNTLLHIAARHGHTEFAEELLRRSVAFLILKNAEEDTALHIAARKGHMEMVALLIDHALAWPIDIEMGEEGPLRLTNKLQNTALHEAVMNRHSRIALKLMEAEPTASHMFNAKKETPLHIAAREGSIHVMFEILSYSWVPPQEEEDPQPFGTGSPLHQAVLGGHPYILDLLLRNRKDFINVTDNEGNTALHYAVLKKNLKLVEKLLKSEPSLAYRKNDEGSTFLIRELLKQCPDVAEQVDSRGRNALHMAAMRGSPVVLRCLLSIIQLEDIVNQADDEGNTPLHLAAQMTKLNSTRILLRDERVNPFIVNKDELTPRRLVIESSGEWDAYYKRQISNVLVRRENQIARKDPQLATFVADLRTLQLLKKMSFATTTIKSFKTNAETYTLVAALIATVTFAAFFTMPGGYDSTGYAQLQSQAAFKFFLLSNTIATCSSLIVVFCFIREWNNPAGFKKVHQIAWGAHRFIFIASVAMLVALMTAVYVVVAKHCMWLAIVVCFICCISSFIIWAIHGHYLRFI